jgi:hypothetical protein
MILHNYMARQHERTNRARKIQARYRRQARFWARLEDPETVLGILGFAFVAGVCMACLVGFLMPI